MGEIEMRYIDSNWLDVWKSRIVCYWTNHATHFGLQTTSRVEGYHAAMERWLHNSKGDLLTIQQLMRTWWQDPLDRHSTQPANSEAGVLYAFRGPLYSRFTNVIHIHALKKCIQVLEQAGCTACSGTYTKTTGLPCWHVLTWLLRNGETLLPTHFHPHLWVDRRMAPASAPPVLLEPRCGGTNINSRDTCSKT